MDPRPWIVLLAILTLFPFAFIGNSSAERIDSEKEPNDSFEEAQRIGEGTTTGSVSPFWLSNNTDFFVVSVPSHLTVRLSLTRGSNDGMFVTATCYDRDGNIHSGMHVVSDSWGKKRSAEWVNEASDPKDIVIEVSGDGSYELKVEIIFVLSNFVKSYMNPLAFAGILMAFVVGMFVGILITKRGMDKDKDEAMAKWEDTREKGSRRFVFLYGVMLFGLSFALIQIITHELTDSSRSWGEFWIKSLLSTILSLLGGVVFGILAWKNQEKRYKKWLESKEKEKPTRSRWGKAHSRSTLR